MSPRAAARLESLGFEQVYDYEGGKADWGSAGLPLEGTNGSDTRAGAHARTDVPTCRLDDRLPAVRAQVAQSGWNTCLVVDERDVVLGRLGRRAMGSDEDVSAGEAMTPGPSTIRPSARLSDVVERMRAQKLESLPVTTADGRLAGVLTLRGAERALGRTATRRSP